MSDRFKIELDWKNQGQGTPEEQATFAAFGIKVDDVWLTEADDIFAKSIVTNVHVSAYRFAEWLAWNWWRLRWEPRKNTVDWLMAHRTSTIGGGYVWPNITFISDGDLVTVESEQTEPKPEEPLRYIRQYISIIASTDFETNAEKCICDVIERLNAKGIRASNLHETWHEVAAERADKEVSFKRRLEALLGFDPDGADPDVIERLVAESEQLGRGAVQELAADTNNATPLSAGQIQELAQRFGAESRPRDAIRLEDKSEAALPKNVTAWKLGAMAARALRRQLGLGAAPISNKRLSELLAVPSTIISRTSSASSLSFILQKGVNDAKIALRSKFEAGRRFDLARLIGDRVTALGNGQLAPVTRSHTYRQKMQRSFAAEFLSPFEAIADRLHQDFSDEGVQGAAEYFNVSPLAVKTLLVNHKLIDRDELQPDPDAVLA